jgi:hypothetical protein
MVGHCTDCSINLPKLSCALYLQNGNAVAEARHFTQFPVGITVIVEKFFLRLLKYTMQAG